MKTPYRPRRANSNTPGIVGFVLAALLACSTLALASQISPSSQARELPSRVDMIVLDAAIPGAPDSKEKGDLPPVLFEHDAHVKALLAAGKSCTSCHEPVASAEDGRNRLDYNFGKSAALKDGKRGPDYSALKTLYHDGCISCHDDMRSDGLTSGPIEPECRSCHAATAAMPEAQRGRVDGGMDPSLHYAHATFPSVVAMTADGEEVCGVCHHPVEPLSSPLLDYDSCRSCHGTDPRPLRGPAYSQVAHTACISCHIDVGMNASNSPETSGNTGWKGGPVLCASCHESSVKASYSRYDDLPRLKVGQPNVVLMGDIAPAADAHKGSMPPVAFDHIRHEKAVPGCISCHGDNPMADGASVYDLVHNPLDPASCVGCHETMKTTWTECAGCHTAQPVTAQPDCTFCHAPLPAAAVAVVASVQDETAISDAERERIAKIIVGARRGMTAPLDLTGVPEVVRIGSLANEYNASEFPHGMIIRSMAEGLADKASGLFFLHADGYTLCQSCHHNSPASLTPPSCASCHAADAGAVPGGAGMASTGIRPSLKVAYHQQCMSCHQRMDLTYPADTDCTACHSKRTPTS